MGISDTLPISIENRGIAPAQLRQWTAQTVKALRSASFPEIDQIVLRSFMLRESATHLLCVSLAYAKDRWSRGIVTLTEMGGFEHDFYTYANMRTGKSYSRAAIDNLIDVGRIFFIAPPEEFPMEISVYDGEGQPTGEIVKFDPLTVCVSKLVHMKAVAKNPKLYRSEIWGQLVNPKVGVATFIETLRGQNSKNSDQMEEIRTNTAFHLYFYGPHLLAKYGDAEPVVLAEVNWDGIHESDDVNDAWEFIVEACRIQGWTEPVDR